MKRINFKMIQTMTALLAFLSFILPGLGAIGSEITAYVSGTAEFRCHFDNQKNISVNQLIYSWEKQTRNKTKDKLVVAELYMGERKNDHISERYRKRDMEFMTNGDLRLFNITLEDEGVYYCYVRHKPAHINLMTVTEHQLNVLANFSLPQITNQSLGNSEVKFLCSSTGGFPKPHEVLWVVSSGNQTEFYRPPCDIKKNSQTFNISSDLTVRIESNTSVSCTVLAHQNFTSKIHYIVIKNEPPMEPPEKNEHLKYILTCGILIACAIGCLTYFCYWRKRKSSKSTGGRVNYRYEIKSYHIRYLEWAISCSLANVSTTPTTAPTDNGASQQREETTSFIGDKVKVNVS